jgi:hypothetical protein
VVQLHGNTATRHPNGPAHAEYLTKEIAALEG